MRFKINETVFVLKDNEYKTIFDCEIIFDVEIYYMSDKTVYPLSELVSLKSCEDVLLNMNLNLEDLLVGLD
jgi:hypothetical protein